MSDRFQQILDDFEFLDDWEDRYRYIIELGKGLPDFPESLKGPPYKVDGCASQVWIKSNVTDAHGPNAVIEFEGDSDAHIVRGLIAILLALYSGKTASEISSINASEEFNKLGLEEHLTNQRANGLKSMVNRIRSEASTILETT